MKLQYFVGSIFPR